MNKRLIIVLAVILLPLPTFGQSTGFEDLTLGTSYSSGSQFTSNGLTFDVVQFGNFGSPASVSDSSILNGQFINLPNTIGLDLQLPANANEVSFVFAAGCCDTGIVVNGTASPLSSGLIGLDGTIVGGANVTVGPFGAFGSETGVVTVTGNINTFVVGGTELRVDDFNVVVPEPTSFTLLSLAGIAICLRRFR